MRAKRLNEVNFLLASIRIARRLLKMADDLTEKVLQAIESARTTGKIKKGTNEVTKSVERGTAKLVAIAKDVTPPEVLMHLPLLAKEKNIPLFEVDKKEELGAAAGLPVATSAVAIIQEGDAKNTVKELASQSKE
jgi:large subunit ribosomal protein L7Ae